MAEELSFSEKLVECRRCGALQPIEAFRRNAKCVDGYEKTCLSCHRKREAARYQEQKPVHRDRHLRRTYGITLEQYDRMVEIQEGRCAVCGDFPDRDSFDVDHDHGTGEVRALLCAPCNRGLGDFRDDPQRLLAAAAYLISHEQLFHV